MASRPAAAPREAAGRARVTWSQGLLTIAADNSSMNGILREVSRQTGMKVTGGVAEERVYGTYGPGSPATVLEALLTGTGTNLLLKEDAEDGPEELLLTPRQGGATPPGPASFAHGNDGDDDDLPPQRILPSPRTQAFPGAAPPSAGTPATQGPTASSPAEASGGSGQSAPSGSSPGGSSGAPLPGSAPPAPATTTEQSPNGVKTPQQIYDELMKLQQQKPGGPPR